MLFKVWLNLCEVMLPATVRRMLKTVLFQASPNVPVSLLTVFRRGDRIRLFLTGYVATLAICFGGVVLTTHIDGTLVGANTVLMYFLNDSVDLWNYALICPCYVGFDLLLLATVVWELPDAFAFIHKLGNKGDSVGIDGRWFGAVVGLTVAASALFVAKFVDDTRNPALLAKDPWWCVPGALWQGRRVLNLSGIYYSLINFGLCVITLLALIAFLRAIATAISIGDAIEAQSLTDELTFEKLKAGASSVTIAYCLGKILVFLYMVNALNWHRLQQAGSINLLALFGALAVTGIWFVSFPRYFIELRWYEFKKKRACALGEPCRDTAYEDIRGKYTAWLAGFLDSVLVGGFVIEAIQVIRQ